MECCLKAYYTKANTMELAYEHLLIVDPERWEGELMEIHNLREQMKEEWLPVIAQATLPLSQPLRRGGHDHGGKIKITVDLKPRELSEDSTPVEFSPWCEEYSIFHSASNRQLASKREQQIILYSLQQRLKVEVCHETPVLDQNNKLPALPPTQLHSGAGGAVPAEQPDLQAEAGSKEHDSIKGKFSAYMHPVRAHSLECALQDRPHALPSGRNPKRREEQKGPGLAENDGNRRRLLPHKHRGDEREGLLRRQGKETQQGRTEHTTRQADEQRQSRSPTATARQILQMRQRRPLHERLQRLQDSRVQRLQETRPPQGGMHAGTAEAGIRQTKAPEGQSRARKSDSSKGDGENCEKVSYVSHARDRGTEAPLLNM